MDAAAAAALTPWRFDELSNPLCWYRAAVDTSLVHCVCRLTANQQQYSVFIHVASLSPPVTFIWPWCVTLITTCGLAEIYTASTNTAKRRQNWNVTVVSSLSKQAAHRQWRSAGSAAIYARWTRSVWPSFWFVVRVHAPLWLPHTIHSVFLTSYTISSANRAKNQTFSLYSIVLATCYCLAQSV